MAISCTEKQNQKGNTILLLLSELQGLVPMVYLPGAFLRRSFWPRQTQYSNISNVSLPMCYGLVPYEREHFFYLYHDIVILDPNILLFVDLTDSYIVQPAHIFLVQRILDKNILNHWGKARTNHSLKQTFFFNCRFIRGFNWPSCHFYSEPKGCYFSEHTWLLCFSVHVLHFLNRCIHGNCSMNGSLKAGFTTALNTNQQTHEQLYFITCEWNCDIVKCHEG